MKNLLDISYYFDRARPGKRGILSLSRIYVNFTSEIFSPIEINIVISLFAIDVNIRINMKLYKFHNEQETDTFFSLWGNIQPVPRVTREKRCRGETYKIDHAKTTKQNPLLLLPVFFSLLLPPLLQAPAQRIACAGCRGKHAPTRDEGVSSRPKDSPTLRENPRREAATGDGDTHTHRHTHTHRERERERERERGGGARG